MRAVASRARRNRASGERSSPQYAATAPIVATVTAPLEPRPYLRPLSCRVLVTESLNGGTDRPRSVSRSATVSIAVITWAASPSSPLRRPSCQCRRTGRGQRSEEIATPVRSVPDTVTVTYRSTATRIAVLPGSTTAYSPAM